MPSHDGMVDPAIFQDLQTRTDEDTAVRDVSFNPLRIGSIVC